MRALAIPQSNPSSHRLPGYPAHEAFGCPPAGERRPIYHHLSLIVRGLEDTPHGVVLHWPIRLAYAFHDLWPSAGTAILSFLAKVWTGSCYVFIFSPSLPDWPLSGMTSPDQAESFQNAYGEWLDKAGCLLTVPLWSWTHQDVLALD